MRMFLTGVSVAAMFTVPASAEIRREDFRVTAELGIELAVREVRDTTPQEERPPVLLLHGARVPGVASFDLAVG